MKILAPLKITDAMLVFHSVPEDDAAPWADATQYDIGQKVLRENLHLVYQAKTQNTGKKPEDNPEDWHCLGASNPWAMFDEKIGTTTRGLEQVRLVLQPGVIASGLALLNLSAKSVRIVVTDGQHNVLFDRLDSTTAVLRHADWWHYFFAPISRQDSLEYLSLPSTPDSRFELTLTGETGETVSCGALLLGEVSEFALAARPGARIGISDYTIKKADEWGNVEVVERAFSKSARWSFLCSGEQVDFLFSTLSALRARPALYIGGKFFGLKVYGFYKEFDIIIEYNRLVECSIELEGLI